MQKWRAQNDAQKKTGKKNQNRAEQKKPKAEASFIWLCS